VLGSLARKIHSVNRFFEGRPWTIWLVIPALFLIGQSVATVIESLPIGPKLAPDSGRYISGGENFPYLDKVQWGYAGYCFLLWVDNLVGADNWLIVALQAGITMAAARVLWDLARTYGGHLVGLLAAAIYLVNPLIATWTRYVLTETFFYASTVFLLWGLNRWLGPSRRMTWLLIVGVVGSLTMRPNGVIMIPALLAVAILLSRTRRGLKIPIAGSAFLAVGLLVSALPTFESGGGGPANSFVQRTARGEVLWNDSEWSIDMPPVAADATSNADYVRYILEHPVDVAKLGAARLGLELIQVRPQRPDVYNAFTAVIMVAFISLFVLGVNRYRRTPLMGAVAVISLPYMGLIAITWAIQEGRFGWWFMTAWIPVVALVVSDAAKGSDDLKTVSR
jgi:4-amino-4-deoxy-L-arabinose transferase-like glycosyltransferase